MELKTAILVDGSFFVNRTNFFKRKYFPSHPELTAEQYLAVLQGIIRRHLSNDQNSRHHLYRTFYYDSAPLQLRIHQPLCEENETNQRIVDFSVLPENKTRAQLLQALRTQRKMALRLGSIKHQKKWKLKDRTVDELLKGETSIEALTNGNFYLDTQQKGVDVKLGLDIASLAYEGLVDQIVLIAGDSDFVPAAKLARMKGIDFVLDCLRSHIDPSLNEHIDGLNSYDLVSILLNALDLEEPELRPPWWDSEDERTNAHRGSKKRSKNKNRRTSGNT